MIKFQYHLDLEGPKPVQDSLVYDWNLNSFPVWLGDTVKPGEEEDDLTNHCYKQKNK